MTAVVRAGVMDVIVICRSAQRTFDTYGLYGLSVDGARDRPCSKRAESANASRAIGRSDCRPSVDFDQLGSRALLRSLVRTSPSSCRTWVS